MSDSQANMPLEDPIIKQIKRLELEYLRLNKRFMQIQDASYIVGLQNRLTIAEAESRDKKQLVKKLENHQKLLDRQIAQQQKIRERVGTDSIRSRQLGSVTKDIQVARMRVDQQIYDIERMRLDADDLNSIMVGE